MKADEVRETFLSYFEKKSHIRKESSSLVPDNDPTVLLTTAGMQQFIPYFLGEAEAPQTRYTTSQKCFRTPDIEEVGDDTHITFFEMLGNFSIGDYFKKEAIAFHWELLTKELGIPPERLWVTVFRGDDEVPKDEEAINLWIKVGVPRERIREFGREDNFWGPPGETGPCGPNTELHYDFGEGEVGKESGPNAEDGRIVEIANIVFMQYFKGADGAVRPLEKQNVDQGTGLERLALVVQHQEALRNGESDNVPRSIFDTDLFTPALDKIGEISQLNYNDHIREFRIIADHVRGAVFLIADGVLPHKEGRGYVLRRVVRRAIEASTIGLGMNKDELGTIAGVVIERFKEAYPEIAARKSKILEVLAQETKQYSRTLEKGEREIAKRVAIMELSEFMKPRNLFDLKETHGMSLDVVEASLLSNAANSDDTKKIATAFSKIDKQEFEKISEEKKEISRKGMKDKFDRAGGGSGEHVATAHTATHLLHAALKNNLGEEANQAGSQLGDGDFRFDFTWPEKLTDEQRQKIEDEVNDQIQKALPVVEDKVSFEEAQKMGAIALFEQKYGNEVRVFTVGDKEKPYSMEVCGGPHVTNTKDIQHFKILKEKSSSAGIRRIKAEVGKTPKDAKLIL